MSQLSKKLKKSYSKRITKKLEEMGIKDEIIYVASGKKRRVMKFDETGKPVMKKNEQGKEEFETELVDIPVAFNKLRSVVRRLRSQPIEVIESFLNMEVAPSASEPTTKVNGE